MSEVCGLQECGAEDGYMGLLPGKITDIAHALFSILTPQNVALSLYKSSYQDY